ncbi:hypothetical protein [Bacillus coahuilensis]|nr:hypothetical protein [Bacillus coahuilensis]
MGKNKQANQHEAAKNLAEQQMSDEPEMSVFSAKEQKKKKKG